MSDVFTITVPIGTRYASVNNTGGDGFRGGKKSPAYTTLFADVKRAAMDAMVLTGWRRAECDCFVTIVRYVGDRRRHDAMNLGKCEFDALTEAGVWADDSLANPCLPMIRYSAPHRMTIVVVKLYESVLRSTEPIERGSGPSTSRPRKAAQAGNDLPEPTVTGSKTSPRAEAGRSAGSGHWCFPCSGWKPNDPIPDSHALLDGKLVTIADALELVDKK